MEGDESPRPKISGPGKRYDLGPYPHSEAFPTEDGDELPESYGTKKLLLAARDPHWLFAAWDLTLQQLREYNAASRDRHLVLRIFKNEISAQPCAEIEVHPESRNWFVNVDKGGTKYLAMLGYYDRKGVWTAVSTSKATLTPPDDLADDDSVNFTSIPVTVPFEQLVEVVRVAVQESLPLAQAIAQLRSLGHAGLPTLAQLETAAPWTPEQKQALAAIINMDTVRRVWIGSMEITELLRRKLGQELSSAAAAEFSKTAGPGGLSSLSSPHGGLAKAKGFWFNINAELIIYGATEPDATVTIGDRAIKLRPDGSFSYRFALPDGEYRLPVKATSADETDNRAADLTFGRHTAYLGKVETHPQDPALKTPKPENLS